jgi:hypothetical protein
VREQQRRARALQGRRRCRAFRRGAATPLGVVQQVPRSAAVLPCEARSRRRAKHAGCGVDSGTVPQAPSASHPPAPSTCPVMTPDSSTPEPTAAMAVAAACMTGYPPPPSTRNQGCGSGSCLLVAVRMMANVHASCST